MWFQKQSMNRQKLLPPNGRYEEFEVNGPQDSRRIVIDMDVKNIYSTRDHYQTMNYEGKANYK